MTDFKHHKQYYFVLVTVLLLGSFLFIVSAPNRVLEAISIVTVGVCYFFLGVVHHVQNHDLHTKIVIEYALIASLGITCVFFMLKVGLGL